MTEPPRLSVRDQLGRRTIRLEKPVFTIGRRTTADLTLLGRDVSRVHAEIARDGDVYVLRDCGSRLGTFVNGERLGDPHVLAHGDQIQLGPGSGVELVFLSSDVTEGSLRDTTSSASELHHLAAILNGLRALGSGQVPEEVLTLVLDSALDVTQAERGFVMLANPDGRLELTIARARGHRTLPGSSFATSHLIPQEVFATGKSRIVGDLMEAGLAEMHHGTVASGIRHVLCVPLRVSPLKASTQPAVESRIIGVLYLDGRERDTMLSSATRASLEAFATQAALAIESARLYAQAAEGAKLEHDLRLAAEVQRAMLPEPRLSGPTFDLAAVAVPCRMVGGDFFDYLELGPDTFGFALGDVAGKGPSAALLAAAVQSNFVAQASVAADPADLLARLNRALLRRAVEARFATLFFGTLSTDGLLRCANAGQDPPVLIRRDGMHPLEAGGPVLGLLPMAAYQFETRTLDPGDLVVVFSDGVCEARNPDDDEFGRERLLSTLLDAHGQSADVVLDRLIASVRSFARHAAQADDLTALVVRHRGA